MKIREVCFPRWNEDVLTGRRTLLHLPVATSPAEDPWAAGDALRLWKGPLVVGAPIVGTPHRVGTVTEARQVRLLDALDTDIEKLGVADREAYLSRWDERFPGCPAATDPLVWRIEFRYHAAWQALLKDPPEWGIAG